MARQALEAAEMAELPRDAALYIASLSTELAEIARRHGLDGLGYILDMARLEADEVVKGSAPGPGTRLAGHA